MTKQEMLEKGLASICYEKSRCDEVSDSNYKFAFKTIALAKLTLLHELEILNDTQLLTMTLEAMNW